MNQIFSQVLSRSAKRERKVKEVEEEPRREPGDGVENEADAKPKTEGVQNVERKNSTPVQEVAVEEKTVRRRRRKSRFSDGPQVAVSSPAPVKPAVIASVGEKLDVVNPVAKVRPESEVNPEVEITPKPHSSPEPVVGREGQASLEREGSPEPDASPKPATKTESAANVEPVAGHDDVVNSAPKANSEGKVQVDPEHVDAPTMEAPCSPKRAAMLRIMEADAALARALARADCNMPRPATTRSQSRRQQQKGSESEKALEEEILQVTEAKPKQRKGKGGKRRASGTRQSTPDTCSTQPELSEKEDVQEEHVCVLKKRGRRAASVVREVEPVVEPAVKVAPVVEEADPNEGTCARTRLIERSKDWKKNRFLPSIPQSEDTKVECGLLLGNGCNARNADSLSARESRQLNRVFRKGVNALTTKVGGAMTPNALRVRKKKTMVWSSKIHGMGLFAGEKIEVDQFVLEYIAEGVRPVIADIREKKYTKLGIGDSYLFRLDNDTILDATHKGSMARFINHSCDPNVFAKIIKVGSEDKIVFYSKRVIQRDEEITYDYKFSIEEEKIPCLCQSSNCRKFLN